MFSSKYNKILSFIVFIINKNRAGAMARQFRAFAAPPED